MEWGGGESKNEKKSNFSKNSAILFGMPLFSKKCDEFFGLYDPPSTSDIDSYVYGSLPICVWYDLLI